MFNKISDRIYIRPADHYTDRPNLGLIAGDRYTLLFEAGNSEMNVIQLKEELTTQNLPSPDFVAVSHWHWDHSFGMNFWGVPTVAGSLTNKYLEKVSRWQWDDESMDNRVKTGEDIVFCNEMIKREYPDRSKICVVPADIIFDGEMTVNLGGVECRLIHCKGPHADDSVLCYIPSEKFVFLGDSNGKDLYGKPWHFDIEHEEDFMEETGKIPYDEDLVKEYLALLDTLDFENCIGGHGVLMTKEELYSSFENK
ncbi:MAG: MBL fold metallo-hydrolase [Oscillospiraceae bacterium]|nr:MBL fold metallo-hydrolase [Oscillospiraceae bacterium]